MQCSGKTVFILGISSDIGQYLAQRYVAEGFSVIGTFRDDKNACLMQNLEQLQLISCDVGDQQSVTGMAKQYALLNQPWDLLISCIGVLEPIATFFQGDFDAWRQSVYINSIGQLGALHALFPHRNMDGTVSAAFFAGGGTNGPFPNYSAYCLGKIVLIKMCELLNAEENINPFIIGTGWVQTKIHQQTLRNQIDAGENYKRTKDFLGKQDVPKVMEDIFQCIQWCCRQGKETVGGRNFSMVHDPWKEQGEELTVWLQENDDRFKLRRLGNEHEGLNKNLL